MKKEITYYFKFRGYVHKTKWLPVLNSSLVAGSIAMGVGGEITQEYMTLVAHNIFNNLIEKNLLSLDDNTVKVDLKFPDGHVEKNLWTINTDTKDKV